MVDHATDSFITVAFINMLSKCFYYTNARDEIMAIWAEKQKKYAAKALANGKFIR